MSAHPPFLDPDTLSELAAPLRGELLSPATPGYDEARKVWNGMIDRRPALIARCRGVADVVDALAIAREHELPVCVRGGGHNVAGSAVSDGGMTIDLSRMRGVRVDRAESTVRVEGGATWADVDRETQLFGLAAPGGVVSTTGVAGLTLGGGYGHLRSKYGLASDNVRSMEVVTADGQVRTANAAQNPDLFWALRGGGGHFGVVTSFEFELKEVGPEVMGLGVIYPLEDAPDILREVRAFMDDPAEDITFDAVGWSVPDVEAFPPELRGRPIMLLGGMYVGSAEDGDEALAPLRNLAEPLLDISARQPFVGLQSGFDPFFPEGLRYYWKSIYLDGLPDDAIDTMVDHMDRRPSPRTIIPLRPRNGVINQIDGSVTAFPERSSPFLLSIDSTWEDPAEDEVNIRWTQEFWEAMAPFASNRMYFNFAMGEEGEDVLRATFGDNYDRLAEVKSTYDPDGLFGGRSAGVAGAE